MRRSSASTVVIACLIAFAVALPVLSVAVNLFTPGTSRTWAHLLSTVLPEYLLNSLWLCAGVGIGVAAIGTGAAWLVALHDFPGRRHFEWALLLPLAMPGYVLAYTYTDALQFVGPLQSWLRGVTGWQKGDYWFPEVRSLGGAIAMFCCILYPYVYLLARTAFLERGATLIEAARVLGRSRTRAFFEVSLPLARPAIVVGVAQALMETLADYGTVAYFAVPTFTTGIYRAWFSLGDRVAAAQLAACLMGFVLLLIGMEFASRGRAAFHQPGGRPAPQRHRLRGLRGWLATLGCLFPLMIGFVVPALLLLQMAFADGDPQFGARYWMLARNSLLLATLAALLAAALALLLAYGGRQARTAQPVRAGFGRFVRLLPRLANRVVSLGYAIPGSVIAVGVLIPVTRLDHWLGGLWQQAFGVHPGLLLTGGISALMYAYLARFLSIGLQTVDAGLTRVTPTMDAAARSLGSAPPEVLRRGGWPLVRPGLLAAALLVFVDVMKELPATMVMRPFNFDTLATQTFRLASDERLSEAATAALMIVAVGLLPIVLLARQIAARIHFQPTRS